jgi:hypothetical protein
MPKTDKPILPNGQPRTGGAAEQNGQHHDYRKLFEALGVGFGPTLSGNQAIATECPFCNGEKFYLNVATGQWDCKSGKCQQSGNVATFLTWIHGERLKQTTDDQYRRLKEKRGGIALQSLKRHGLAYDDGLACWLIPFKSSKDSVVNLQLYYPDGPTKYRNLPELPTAIFGFDRLSSANKELPVLLCEGAFDAIALDYTLGGNQGKYVCVASPGGFKDIWAEYFKDRKVQAFYDNDDGGRAHTAKVQKVLLPVVADLRLLRWPDGYEGCDLNDLIRRPEFTGKSILGFLRDNSYAPHREPQLVIHDGRRKEEDRPVDWIWPDHLHCGTYASFSGARGTFKSTIAAEVAARYTRGLPMPKAETVGMPAGHVLYLFIEDTRSTVEDRFQHAGGDFDKWHAWEAHIRSGEPLNILEHLSELEATIRQLGIRLVIIDGQNSVVGQPNISTDMLARTNVTNKLHQFAQRLNICLLCLRNEDKEKRAMGPQSMGDMARCIWRTQEHHRAFDEPPDGFRYFALEFPRITLVAAAKSRPIQFAVADNASANAPVEILWGKSKPTPIDPPVVKKVAAGLRNRIEEGTFGKGVK